MQERIEVYDDRRNNLRWSVKGVLQAIGTISEKKQDTDAHNDGRQRQSWSGMVVNISDSGAQIVLPGSCADKFTIDQQVMMCLAVKQEDIKVDLAAQIKSILQEQSYNTVIVGVQFVDLQSNPEELAAVKRTCELAAKLKMPSLA